MTVARGTKTDSGERVDCVRRWLGRIRWLPCCAGRADARYGRPLEADDPLREEGNGPRLILVHDDRPFDQAGSRGIFVDAGPASKRDRRFEFTGTVNFSVVQVEENLVAC